MKGSSQIIIDNVSITTTSNEIVIPDNFNAVLVTVKVTGTWKIDIQGRLDKDGTVMDIFDNNDSQLTTGNLTTSRMKLFVAIPNLLTIKANLVAAGNCTVRIQPINV